MTQSKSTFYDLSVVSITGEKVPLSTYRGQAVLIVNTASACGLTPQYQGLQQLYVQNKDRGLVVLGFPSNDFGAQEPGTDKEIQDFCGLKYKITFPMFTKAPVKGSAKQPLYTYLIEQSPKKDEISWNFEKFLIGRDGQFLARFAPDVEPLSAEVKAAIDKALG